MTTVHWLDKLRRWLADLPASSHAPASPQQFGGEGVSWLRGLAGRSPEIADVQEQVATEQQGRIALVSRQGALNQWLLAILREQAVLPAEQAISQEGFFILITLPEPATVNGEELATGEWPAGQHWARQEVMEALIGSDLILYLSDCICDQTGGWQADDDRWYARLRATATPILPVMTASPAQAELPAAQFSDYLRRHLGTKPVLLQRNDEDGDSTALDSSLRELVERLLELRPRLAIPLAQEMPACRQLIARRVVRSGAFMAALLGMEPLPLLDLPLTVLVQWKMALQLAAIHGRPGMEVLSSEMASTVGLNLLVRTAAQQALKLLPLFGWLFSSALNFVSTWLLGQALLNVYTEGQDKNLRAGLAGLGQKLRPSLRWPLVHLSLLPSRFIFKKRRRD